MWSPGHMKWQKLSVQGTLNPSPRLSCEHHDKQKFNYGRRKAIKEHSHFLAFINQEHIYELYCSMLTGENRTTGKKTRYKTPSFYCIIMNVKGLWALSFAIYNPVFRVLWGSPQTTHSASGIDIPVKNWYLL